MTVPGRGEVIADQEAHNLPVVNDGEFRGVSFGSSGSERLQALSYCFSGGAGYRVVSEDEQWRQIDLMMETAHKFLN